MDGQNKNSVGAVEVMESRGLKEQEGKISGLLGLRVLALVLSLTAAVVLGVDKQTETVPIQLTPSLPPLNVPVVAKWHYLSAFVFSVVSNAIACAYAAASILVTCSARKNTNTVPIILTLDLFMVALLFCSNGAATAIGLMGYEGNSHVRWNKVCHVFGRFCHQVAAALVLSLIASIAFLLLVMLTALRLHRKSK